MVKIMEHEKKTFAERNISGQGETTLVTLDTGAQMYITGGIHTIDDMGNKQHDGTVLVFDFDDTIAASMVHNNLTQFIDRKGRSDVGVSVTEKVQKYLFDTPSVDPQVLVPDRRGKGVKLNPFGAGLKNIPQLKQIIETAEKSDTPVFVATQNAEPGVVQETLRILLGDEVASKIAIVSPPESNFAPSVGGGKAKFSMGRFAKQDNHLPLIADLVGLTDTHNLILIDDQAKNVTGARSKEYDAVQVSQYNAQKDPQLEQLDEALKSGPTSAMVDVDSANQKTLESILHRIDPDAKLTTQSVITVVGHTFVRENEADQYKEQSIGTVLDLSPAEQASAPPDLPPAREKATEQDNPPSLSKKSSPSRAAKAQHKASPVTDEPRNHAQPADVKSFTNKAAEIANNGTGIPKQGIFARILNKIISILTGGNGTEIKQQFAPEGAKSYSTFLAKGSTYTAQVNVQQLLQHEVAYINDKGENYAKNVAISATPVFAAAIQELAKEKGIDVNASHDGQQIKITSTNPGVMPGDLNALVETMVQGAAEGVKPITGRSADDPMYSGVYSEVAKEGTEQGKATDLKAETVKSVGQDLSSGGVIVNSDGTQQSFANQTSGTDKGSDQSMGR